MENSKTTTQQKKKKANLMQKIGKSIKDTFIEMSSSLAGWIDDTSEQLSGKKKTPKTPKCSSPTSSKSGAKFTQSNS